MEKYQFIRKLGLGSEGYVVLAMEKESKRKVAIKAVTVDNTNEDLIPSTPRSKSTSSIIENSPNRKSSIIEEDESLLKKRSKQKSKASSSFSENFSQSSTKQSFIVGSAPSNFLSDARIVRDDDENEGNNQAQSIPYSFAQKLSLLNFSGDNFMLPLYEEREEEEDDTISSTTSTTSTNSSNDHLLEKEEDSKKTAMQKLIEEIKWILTFQNEHPHIVQHLDYFTETSETFMGAQTTIYVVMEFCEGGDLNSFFNKITPNTHLPIDIVINWCLQITDCIQFLHANRVIHRDIKSENILLSQSEEPWDKIILKIGDFGCTKMVQDNMLKTVRGTISFMAPEVFDHRAYDESADIWSLGLVFYQILTCTPSDRLPSFKNQIATNPNYMKQFLLQSSNVHYLYYKSCGEEALSKYKQIVEMIYYCLQFDITERPTATEIIDYLQKQPVQENSQQLQQEVISKSTTPAFRKTLKITSKDHQMLLSSVLSQQQQQVQDGAISPSHPLIEQQHIKNKQARDFWMQNKFFESNSVDWMSFLDAYQQFTGYKKVDKNILRGLKKLLSAKHNKDVITLHSFIEAISVAGFPFELNVIARIEQFLVDSTVTTPQQPNAEEVSSPVQMQQESVREKYLTMVLQYDKVFVEALTQECVDLSDKFAPIAPSLIATVNSLEDYWTANDLEKNIAEQKPENLLQSSVDEKKQRRRRGSKEEAHKPFSVTNNFTEIEVQSSKLNTRNSCVDAEEYFSNNELEAGYRVLFLGPTASGKTILMKRLLLLFAGRSLQSPQNMIPIYVPISNLNNQWQMQQEKGTTLISCLLRASADSFLNKGLRYRDSIEQFLTSQIDSSQVILLLDGFDDANENLKKKIIQELNFNWKNAIVIFSMRSSSSGAYIMEFQENHRTELFQVLPLGIALQVELARRLLKRNEEDKNNFSSKDSVLLNALQRGRFPSSVVSNPFLLSLLVHEYKQKQVLLYEKEQFYELTIHTLITMYWKRKKRNLLQISNNKLNESNTHLIIYNTFKKDYQETVYCLLKLSHYLYLQRSRDFSVNDVEFVKLCINDTLFKNKWTEIALDVQSGIFTLLEHSGQQFRFQFPHLQDYFIAKLWSYSLTAANTPSLQPSTSKLNSNIIMSPRESKDLSIASVVEDMATLLAPYSQVKCIAKTSLLKKVNSEYSPEIKDMLLDPFYREAFILTVSMLGRKDFKHFIKWIVKLVKQSNSLDLYTTILYNMIEERTSQQQQQQQQENATHSIVTLMVEVKEVETQEILKKLLPIKKRWLQISEALHLPSKKLHFVACKDSLFAQYENEMFQFLMKKLQTEAIVIKVAWKRYLGCKNTTSLHQVLNTLQKLSQDLQSTLQEVHSLRILCKIITVMGLISPFAMSDKAMYDQILSFLLPFLEHNEKLVREAALKCLTKMPIPNQLLQPILLQGLFLIEIPNHIEDSHYTIAICKFFIAHTSSEEWRREMNFRWITIFVKLLHSECIKVRFEVLKTIGLFWKKCCQKDAKFEDHILSSLEFEFANFPYWIFLQESVVFVEKSKLYLDSKYSMDSLLQDDCIQKNLIEKCITKNEVNEFEKCLAVNCLGTIVTQFKKKDNFVSLACLTLQQVLLNDPSDNVKMCCLRSLCIIYDYCCMQEEHKQRKRGHSKSASTSFNSTLQRSNSLQQTASNTKFTDELSQVSLVGNRFAKTQHSILNTLLHVVMQEKSEVVRKEATANLILHCKSILHLEESNLLQSLCKSLYKALDHSICNNLPTEEQIFEAICGLCSISEMIELATKHMTRLQKRKQLRCVWFDQMWSKICREKSLQKEWCFSANEIKALQQNKLVECFFCIQEAVNK